MKLSLEEACFPTVFSLLGDTDPDDQMAAAG